MKTLAIVGGLAALSAVGYAVYFDYKRRNDVEFRKSLKLQKKLAEKAKLAEQKQAEELMIQLLTKSLELVKNVDYPASIEGREKFFTESLQEGETLMRQEPDNLPAIAACFYKAVKVYPNPVDLLVILQKSLPEDIVGLVYGMISTETKSDESNYYGKLVMRFPTVTINEKTVIAKTNIDNGHVIYMEDPLITCLSSKSLALRNRCHYCLSDIPSDLLGDPDLLVQCEDGYTQFQSSKCHKQGLDEFYKFMNTQSTEEGSQAIRKLMEHCIKVNSMYPLMVGKFLAKMIGKQVEGGKRQKQDNGSMIAEEWEHLEKLPVKIGKDDVNSDLECQLIRAILMQTAPGIAEFLTIDRYVAIKSALSQNSMGIHGDNDDDNGGSCGNDRPRTSVAYERILGAGLYIVTAYISHSDSPNACVDFVFPNKMTYGKSKKSLPSPKLILRALRPINEGEEIFISHYPRCLKEEEKEVHSKQSGIIENELASMEDAKETSSK